MQYLRIARSLFSVLFLFAFLYGGSARADGLTPIQNVFDGIGMEGPVYSLESSDGRFIYVLTVDDDSLAVYERDATTGDITFIEALRDGVDGLDGLDVARRMVLSPDDNGAHLYVIAGFDNSVTAFSRDQATGRLTHIETLRKEGVDSSQNSLESLHNPEDVVIRPDGGHLYVVASQIIVPDDGGASFGAGTLNVFERNKTTGRLTLVQVVLDQGVDTNGTVDNLEFPSNIALTPDGSHAFVTNRDHDGALLAFSATPLLTHLYTYQQQGTDSEGNGLSHLADAHSVTVAPDGKSVYLFGRNSGFLPAITEFLPHPTSGLPTLVLSQTITSNAVGSIGGAFAISPDGEHFLSAGGGTIAIFNRDTANGELTAPLIDEYPGHRDIHHIGFSTDGTRAYVSDPAREIIDGYDTHLERNGLFIHNRNSTDGTLTFDQKLIDHPENSPLEFLTDLGRANRTVVSPDGKHVYVSSQVFGLHLFTRNGNTGKLSFSAKYIQDATDAAGNLLDNFGGISDVTISPDGLFLYATSQAGVGAINVFSRNASTGELTRVDRITDFSSPLRLSISRDGDYLYFIDFGSSGRLLRIYQRDAQTGSLTLIQTFTNGELDGNDQTIQGAPAIKRIVDHPSRDVLFGIGRQNFMDELLVFERNPANGKLSILHTYKEDDLDADGVVLDRLSALTHPIVSPDGLHLYLGASNDDLDAFQGPDTLLAFGIDTTSSELRLIQSIVENVEIVNGEEVHDHLRGILRLEITADGVKLLVLSRGFNRAHLGLYERDIATGMLEFVEFQKEGVNGFAAMDGAGDLCISADGKNAYIASYEDDAIQVVGMQSGGGFSCPEVPNPACTVHADTAVMKLTNHRNETGSLVSLLLKRPMLTAAELADPADSDYRVCLYTDGALVGSWLAPAGDSNFIFRAGRNVQYTNKSNPSGLKRLFINEKRISAHLNNGPSSPLPFDITTTVQIGNANSCWGQSWSPDHVRVNGTRRPGQNNGRARTKLIDR